MLWPTKLGRLAFESLAGFACAKVGIVRRQPQLVGNAPRRLHLDSRAAASRVAVDRGLQKSGRIGHVDDLVMQSLTIACERGFKGASPETDRRLETARALRLK